jgi:hypothetical protein
MDVHLGDTHNSLHGRPPLHFPRTNSISDPCKGNFSPVEQYPPFFPILLILALYSIVRERRTRESILDVSLLRARASKSSPPPQTKAIGLYHFHHQHHHRDCVLSRLFSVSVLTMSAWNKTYHWRTFDGSKFSKQYFTEKLVGTSYDLASPTPGKVEVESLANFEGDVELGNRKGKLITIYDCQITLNWEGKLESGTEAKGTIFFPEVSHEIEDEGDEYRVSTRCSETWLKTEGDTDYEL